MKKNFDRPIDYYIYQYPQLTLGVKNGTKDSKAYKDIVLRGEMPNDLSLPIKIKEQEELIKVETPIGLTEVLYLPEREVFEYFVKVLAYRNEDKPIEKTTGAIFINGLNNWRKIEAHHEDFLKNNKEEEWGYEFDKFVSEKQNYQGSVLLISRGNYSALPAALAGFEQEKWLALSKKIRIYHEISHQISRKLYLPHKDAIRDEVIADCIGIVAALNRYDKNLHQKVLGIIDGEYKNGGRLENYVEKEKLDEAVVYTKELIDKLDIILINNKLAPFDLLIKLEEEYVR